MGDSREEPRASAEGIRSSIEGAVRHLREHPEEARGMDGPATASLEGGLKFRVEGIGGQKALTDMATGAGGEASAPSPRWLLRAALAGCDATVIAMRAAQLGVVLTKLEVSVDGESDDRGLLGVDDSIPPGPLWSRTRVQVAASEVAPDQLRDIVQWAVAHSPVADALHRAIPTRTEVDVA